MISLHSNTVSNCSKHDVTIFEATELRGTTRLVKYIVKMGDTITIYNTRHDTIEYFIQNIEDLKSFNLDKVFCSELLYIIYNTVYSLPILTTGLYNLIDYLHYIVHHTEDSDDQEDYVSWVNWASFQRPKPLLDVNDTPVFIDHHGRIYRDAGYVALYLSDILTQVNSTYYYALINFIRDETIHFDNEEIALEVMSGFKERQPIGINESKLPVKFYINHDEYELFSKPYDTNTYHIRAVTKSPYILNDLEKEQLRDSSKKSIEIGTAYLNEINKIHH